MATIFDVTQMTVAELNPVSLGSSIETITITDVVVVPNITLNVPTAVEVVTVTTAGPQGVPGDQMVFPQETSPAVQYSWGAGDAKKVWIEVPGL